MTTGRDSALALLHCNRTIDVKDSIKKMLFLVAANLSRSTLWGLLRVKYSRALLHGTFCFNANGNQALGEWWLRRVLVASSSAACYYGTINSLQYQSGRPRAVFVLAKWSTIPVVRNSGTIESARLVLSVFPTLKVVAQQNITSHTRNITPPLPPPTSPCLV